VKRFRGLEPEDSGSDGRDRGDDDYSE
jgi:hypothetical protein